MTSEQLTNGLPKFAEENPTNELKTNFMSHCYSFLQDDEEARQCVQTVWNKYLQCVGDVAMVNLNFLFAQFIFPVF
jgi:hypothetical protein